MNYCTYILVAMFAKLYEHSTGNFGIFWQIFLNWGFDNTFDNVFKFLSGSPFYTFGFVFSHITFFYEDNVP